MAIELFTSSGTWIVPQDVSEVLVECWGAGGGSPVPATSNAVAGGGGGAYARRLISVVPNMQIPYTVGMGSEGADGGDTYWDDGSLVLAKGGLAGGATDGGLGGSSTASVGSTKYAGGNGADRRTVTFSGAGGGGAGSTGDGKDASGGTAGGATADNGGAGGEGRTTRGAGHPGNLYGGGAGGSSRSLFSDGDAAAGGNGLLRITYTIIEKHIGSSTVLIKVNGLGTGVAYEGSLKVMTLDSLLNVKILGELIEEEAASLGTEGNLRVVELIEDDIVSLSSTGVFTVKSISEGGL